MSDEHPPADPTPPENPAPRPAPVVPAVPAPAPIDYALPTQQKSWLPTPEMVRNLGCLFKVLLGFTVLIVMGYFALVALNPKARQWALQGTKPGPNGAPPSGKGPTPFKFVNQILAIPAQALGKTDDVVKANNARVGQLDGVIKDEEDKAKGKSGRSGHPVVDPFSTPSANPEKKSMETGAGPQSVSGSTLLALAEKQSSTSPAPANDDGPPPIAPRPSPPAPSAPEGPDQLKLPGDILIAQASPAGAPRGSAAFFYAIVKLTISGITQGTQGKPSRALINNRLTYEGDEINPALGITFAQLDGVNKLLVFKDNSGATVTRSY